MDGRVVPREDDGTGASHRAGRRRATWVPPWPSQVETAGGIAEPVVGHSVADMSLTCIDAVLLSDPRVAAVPVVECGEPLVVASVPRLRRTPDPVATPGALVRAGVARRLATADAALPPGVHLVLAEGWRSPAAQSAIVTRYRASVRADHPLADDDEVERLTSRYVSPVAVAPHVAGSAVDVTLVDDAGRELDLGCPLDATPEESDGRCFTDAAVPPTARVLRTALGEAMTAAGFVNYPTEWWHWSHGDRYWALTTGQPSAVYGPVPA